MCITNIFTDQYPDGQKFESYEISYCQDGQPNQPCQKLSTVEHPPRRIQFGEPTTESVIIADKKGSPHISSDDHSSGSRDTTLEEGGRQPLSNDTGGHASFVDRSSHHRNEERIDNINSPHNPSHITPPDSPLAHPSEPGALSSLRDGGSYPSGLTEYQKAVRRAEIEEFSSSMKIKRQSRENPIKVASSVSGLFGMPKVFEDSLEKGLRAGNEMKKGDRAPDIAETARRLNSGRPFPEEDKGETATNFSFQYITAGDISPQSDSPSESSECSLDSSVHSPFGSPQQSPTPARTRIVHEANFTLEEFNESDYEAYDSSEPAIQPLEYEDVESDCESGVKTSGTSVNLDSVSAFNNLMSNENKEDDDEEQKRVELEKMRAEKRRKRRSTFAHKRSWMQKMESDTDDEDLTLVADEKVNELGSSARRVRRKTNGERMRIIFDNPPPIIDDFEESLNDSDSVFETPDYTASIDRMFQYDEEESRVATQIDDKAALNYLESPQESLDSESSPAFTNEQPFLDPGSVTPGHRSLSRSSSLESLQSLVDSIFSTATFSSASTVAGVDDAFQRILAILKADSVLRDLYSKIVSKTSAGKFNRNFGTLLKRFALDLEKEATCWNEQRAAQFIRSRARKLAEKVSDSVYPSETADLQPAIIERDNVQSSDDSDSNSDSEPDEFQELEKFIAESVAFHRLRIAFQAFLRLGSGPPNVISDQNSSKLFAEMPFAEVDELAWSAETIHREQDQRCNRPILWNLRNLSQNIKDLLESERPVAEGMSRVKWKCPCGEYLYDDYRELKPGAAKRMEDYLSRSSHKLHASSSVCSAGTISTVRSSIKSLATSISSHMQPFGRSKKTELIQTELRYYSDGRATRTPAHTSGEVYYLLLCHNDGVGAEIVKLRQPEICDINTDQKLFSLLHDEYKILRKRWWTWISLWTLQSIKFVRFELYENELVDIKKEDEVPPPSKDNEYRHGPPNPPELNPPLGSTLLMHLFKHPELAGTRKHCLKKIPRKLRERLAIIDEGNDPIGWGLQFIEGWSKKRLMYLTAVTFGLCSLVVLIAVSILGQNIQNAAAIASFMLSFVTIGIATAQAALHMP